MSKEHPFDVCWCGDYRHQHVDGMGRCLLGSLCTPSPCMRFRFSSGPSQTDLKKPEHQEKPDEFWHR